MFTNPTPVDISKMFKCNRNVMRYLVYKKGIPILHYDKDYYYFTDNDVLRKALKEMPPFTKVFSNI